MSRVASRSASDSFGMQTLALRNSGQEGAQTPQSRELCCKCWDAGWLLLNRQPAVGEPESNIFLVRLK